MPTSTVTIPTVTMDASMASSGEPECLKKEDDSTYVLCEMDHSILMSDSDEDHSDSSEEDEEMLQAAEGLLRGLEMRRSVQRNFSMRSLGSVGTVDSSIGSISSLCGAPPAQIEERMMKRSVKNMEEKKMSNSASVSDLQTLLSQPSLPASSDKKKKVVDEYATIGRGERRHSSSVLHIPGHIGQEMSAQAVEVDDGAMNPDDHLAQLLGAAPQKFSFDSLDGFFLAAKPEHLQAWTNELTKAVREHKLPLLQQMHQRGEMLQACNNFGESIVHLTVRRGTPQMLRFLLQDAQLSMRVCCDLGRTPLHDAAWCLASNPKSYQMMALLLNESPMQLFITDKRGFTPLAYVPRAKWAECNAFLDRQHSKGRFASLCTKQ